MRQQKQQKQHFSDFLNSASRSNKSKLDINETMPGELWNIVELSDELKVSVNTIYAWVNQRKIPYIKLGRLLRFRKKDIAGWIQEQLVETKSF